MRVSDERHVIATRERAVDRRPYAGVGLRAGHDKSTDSSLGEDILEIRVLERVAVRLVNKGFGIEPWELMDVCPVITPLRQSVIGMLYPDNWFFLFAGFVNQRLDVADDL